MIKISILVASFLIYGCGYTTRGFVHEGGSIYIEPVANEIDITAETRHYSGYRTYPILLENRLTNELVRLFNSSGVLKPSPGPSGSLRLSSAITDYRREALRYSESDDVQEQRLYLEVRVRLFGQDGAVLKERSVTGETSFFLEQTNNAHLIAQRDAVEDAARRIVEMVIEEW